MYRLTMYDIIILYIFCNDMSIGGERLSPVSTQFPQACHGMAVLIGL